MSYDNWMIDAEVVPHVKKVENNTTDGVITLECVALKENIQPGDSDPRDEIARFQDMSSQYVNNTPLLNGGSKLQVGNGDYVTVTDGTDTWERCGLSRVVIGEDHGSDKRIDYTLTIYYEMEGSGTSYVYLGDEGYPADYTNIVAYRESDGSGSACTVCTDFGRLTITEESNVKRVEVYGCAYNSYTTSLATINCNDEQEQVWSYNKEGDLPIGLERISWDLETPTTTIVLQTSLHTNPFTGINGLGCWLQWIKVYYE